MDDLQYGQAELLQVIGQLYMEVSRSNIMMRQFQQVIKDKDSVISVLQDQIDEHGSADKNPA